MHVSAKQRKLHVVMTTFIAVTAVLGVFWYLSKTPEREADRVVSTLRKVQLGKTPIEEVIQAMPGSWVAGTVTDSRSGYQLTLTNEFLRRLKLAPIAGVIVNIGAGKGTVDEMQIFWEIGESGNTADVRFFQVANHEPQCGRSLCVKRRNGQEGRPWMIQIDASPAVPTAERNKFLDFNTSCLSKIGGCKDARELLSTPDAQ